MFNTIYDYRYGQSVLTEAAEIAKEQKKIEAFKKKVKKAKQIKDLDKKYSVFVNELYPEYKKSAHRTGTAIALAIMWIGAFTIWVAPTLGIFVHLVGSAAEFYKWGERFQDCAKILNEEIHFLDEKIAVAKAKGNKKELEELERLRDRLDTAAAEADFERDWK